MKSETPGSVEMEKLCNLIDRVEVAMLTTCSADGSIVSRPLQTLQYSSSNELIFFTGADSDKVNELSDRPAVNLIYSNPSKQIYVSVRGHASVDHDRDLIEKLWSPAFKVYFEQGKEDPNLAVLHVRVRDAIYWEASGNFAGRAIHFAQAAMSHDPSKMGEHGTLTPHSP